MGAAVSRDFSAVLKRQLFKQEMDGVMIVLVSITHPDFPQEYHVSSDNKDVLSTGERGTISNGVEYTEYPFDLVMAEQSDNLMARARLRIDNVHRDIMVGIQSIENGEHPNVRVQVVLDKEPDRIVADSKKMRLSDVKATAIVIEGDLIPNILQGGKFPKYTFNAAHFPALNGR